ncbi:MAG: hypothetical protein ACTH41_10670, partial [Lactococcus cremoris]
MILNYLQMLVPLFKRSKTFTNANINFKNHSLIVLFKENRGGKGTYFYLRLKVSALLLKNEKIKSRNTHYSYELNWVTRKY